MANGTIRKRVALAARLLTGRVTAIEVSDKTGPWVTLVGANYDEVADFIAQHPVTFEDLRTTTLMTGGYI